jgi:hypothetical protein
VRVRGIRSVDVVAGSWTGVVLVTEGFVGSTAWPPAAVATDGRARVGFLLAEAMYDMREIPPGEESFAIVVAELIDRERGADR